jgi:phosphatidylethanolamine-binding protein (PEBP) family uncharacterized protein
MTTVLWEQASAKAVRNGFGQTDYSGPCPSLDDGPHRYVFWLHALDVATLDVHAGPDRHSSAHFARTPWLRHN